MLLLKSSRLKELQKPKTLLNDKNEKSNSLRSSTFFHTVCLPQALVGRFSGDIFIHVDKIRDAVVSALCSNLADRCIVAAEQFFGLIDACTIEK